MVSKEEPGEPAPPARAPRSDRSPWNWLLIVPVVVPLLTFLYNGDSPRLGGIPAFYWMQMLFIPFGVACTVIVYRMTRKRG
ncbi:DUF3311 domain-containing protein [Actinomadura algeriensis]|uniref:DUF3311 domain-containing protein n=1 Tax=Actinomadura algeriensis TaxID=1679523 RepID=A0ABR9JZG6_9ACTN|nr:DUF3311 domain-containing protein [Actinomadura algeriensis]MBE1535977.1 hypothetical protein [Actinomadura algeriensis]